MDPDIERSLNILGLTEDISLEEVERVYRGLVASRTSWGDVKEINWAYECLREHIAAREAAVTSRETPAAEPEARPANNVSSRRIILGVIVSSAILAAVLAVLAHFNVINLQSSPAPGDLSDIIKSVKPAIVTILTEGTPRGSGFVVSKDGYIVTNAHVMREKTGKAAFTDGSVTVVELIFMDPELDFALLKTADTRQYQYLRLGDSSACFEGETVIAAGTPLSFDTTFTRGIISASKRSFPAYRASFIQTDAALSPGNSGGPLINLKGDVIGVNSLKISGISVEGMGFAVSINDVKQHIIARKRMSDDDLSRQLARMEKKMEEMSQWRNQASAREEKSARDRMVEEQWERDRRRKEFAERVEEANRSLREQKEQEERRIHEEGDRYRKQMREQMETKRKALSECLQAANHRYQTAWNDSCASTGLDAKCKLPYSTARILEQRLMQTRNECFRLYPQ
ncbi:MAG: trypsin-like peptidase domain-containing protein [Syntrophorhabdaceae bacterium]|nr:trypsin-like peptidase domain-containing protein [Syntrophorhabdaceae bacterium]